ncbi:MAG: tetratricopeptide repeat protein, partial [Pseudobdellovibrionaceae bacterium]
MRLGNQSGKASNFRVPSLMLLLSFPLIVLAAPSWNDFRSQIESGKKKEALATLTKLKEEPKNSTAALVGLGYYNFIEGRNSDAEKYLLESLKTTNPLEDYAHYFLGQIYKAGGNLEEARKHFSVALQQGATDKVELDSAFELGQIAINNKKWKEAKSLWKRLERRL